MWVDEFQKQTWADKYRYGNETFPEFCYRIASNIFPNDEEKRDKLFKRLQEFKILFGGRINANIGTGHEGTTLFNCFIEATSRCPDSLEGIMDMVTKAALTLKTEGGVGFCANYLRPSKTLIRKIGVTTPGSIKFLEIFDRVSEVITSGSVDKEDSKQGKPTKNSIRKGAMMVTMSICHPDIVSFITAKSTPNRLTKMNMSVMVTDAFTEAVKNDNDWSLWFPDIYFEKYDSEWDGNFEKWAEKGYPVVTYEVIKARYLWDLIMKNSFTRNEPGVLFIDNARKMDNLWYLDGSSMLATNPCSEIFGNTGTYVDNGVVKTIGDVCNLGSLSIVRYYNYKKKEFDYASFLEDAALLVESLDNIIDVSGYPLEEYKLAAVLKRKIGIGITGIGSLMMMMNIRYGSEECVCFLDNLGSKFINKLYETSALLAERKGPFALYSEKYLDGGFVKNSGVLTDKTITLINKHGMRHSALCAIAPNGTLSILAGNVSGGIEPVFSKEFTRWYRVEGKKTDFAYPNIHKGEWFETDYFKEDVIGGDKFLLSSDGQYRVDKNNGLCKKVVIKDYGYKIAEEMGFENTAGAMELSVEEHLNVLATMSKYVDQSSSKTINLPADTSFEDFKKLYNNIHSIGIKGCTTYREGTSVAVLEAVKKEKEKSIKTQQKEFLDAFKTQNGSVVIEQDVKLPDEFPATVFILRSDSKKWYLTVSWKDPKTKKHPFSIFVTTNAKEDNVPTFNSLDKLEALALYKGLKKERVEETKAKYAYQKNPVKICRMLGLLLRHNVDVYSIVKALDEVEEAHVGTFVFRIKKFLAQFVEKIDDPQVCSECGEKSLIFSEGCFLCENCGCSRCG